MSLPKRFTFGSMVVRGGFSFLIVGALLAACNPSASTGSASPEGGLGDGGGAGTGPVLPDGTLLYLHTERSGNDIHDSILARDLASNSERVVTDLTGDGSTGWEVWGFALSPDRRRIAISSLYGPTKEDNATGLATRAIWTLATDGTDFRRLTPTFPNDAAGRQSFTHDVSNPEWTADGSHVLFDFGTYWYQGGTLRGGSFPWSISAAGGDAPSSVLTPTDCGQVIYPSRNPVTGDILFLDEICIPGQGEGDGLYLYPADGSKTPKKIIASAHVDGNVDVFLAKPAWFPDGSGFLFIGGVTETDWRPSLLAYDMTNDKISLLATAPEETGIDSVALSPDATKVVYCLRQNNGAFVANLHLIDLTSSSLTDTAITTDGKSCSPSF